jgi:hypothetical protein
LTISFILSSFLSGIVSYFDLWATNRIISQTPISASFCTINSAFDRLLGSATASVIQSQGKDISLISGSPVISSSRDFLES